MSQSVVSLTELESDAQHLRACLQRASPLHGLLCGLQFFEKLAGDSRPAIAGFIEASLREFVPDLVVALEHTEAGELRPTEIRQFEALHTLTVAAHDVVAPSDLAALTEFWEKARSRSPLAPPSVADDQVVLAALFVEYNPDLRLPPRGRLLWLRVEAEERRHGKADDEPVIRNAIIKVEGEFWQQATLAVRMAREYLARVHGLNPRKRFRIDFEVLGAPVSLTGPSLGLAMAVGAVVAIAKREVLRCTLDVPTGVAFSGALSDAGEIRSIDSEGLRLKLACALHAGLKYVVVPRSQITGAWEFLRSQDAPPSDHPLRLVEADDVASVLDDRNLVFPQRRTATSYQVRRARKSLRQPRVGLPILALLIAILGILSLPELVKRFDRNPQSLIPMTDGFRALNKYGIELWKVEPECPRTNDDTTNVWAWAVGDLNGDGRNEVLFEPYPAESPERLCGRNDRVEVYDPRGSLMFWRQCSIASEYAGDDQPGLYYWAHGLYLIRTEMGPIISTAAVQQNPSRAHLRFWNAEGDSLGWYINAGGTRFVMAHDFDGDGLEDLFFIGFNIRMRAAALYVLRAKGSFGAAPPYTDPQYDLSHVRPGNQLRYMIFPKTDLSEADTLLYNNFQSLSIESDGSYRMEVGEGKCEHCIVDYYLDKNLRVQRVDVTDQFRARRLKLVESGALPAVPWTEYFNSLRDTVTHWTPAGWVPEESLPDLH